MLVVPKIPVPVSVVALFPELADMVAVGVPPATLITANFELAVDTPPRRRSKTVASLGWIVPFADTSVVILLHS
jgi:hypothetical protein